MQGDNREGSPGEGGPRQGGPGEGGSRIGDTRGVKGTHRTLTWGSGRSGRGRRVSAGPPPAARCLPAPWKSRRQPRAQRFSGAQVPGAAARRPPSRSRSPNSPNSPSSPSMVGSGARSGARSGVLDPQQTPPRGRSPLCPGTSPGHFRERDCPSCRSAEVMLGSCMCSFF